MEYITAPTKVRMPLHALICILCVHQTHIYIYIYTYIWDLRRVGRAAALRAEVWRRLPAQVRPGSFVLCRGALLLIGAGSVPYKGPCRYVHIYIYICIDLFLVYVLYVCVCIYLFVHT